MLVDIKTTAICKIDIKSEEAFKILCKTLDMEFVFDEKEFFIKKDEYDTNCVWVKENGKEKIFDERGDLFIALRNVAVNMFPNLDFRSEPYIYHN